MTTEQKDRLIELLGICGCVEDEVFLWIVNELRRCGHGTYDASIESQKARIYLDAKDWIEHGTSIRGSWLTEDGEKVLREIEAMGGL